MTDNGEITLNEIMSEQPSIAAPDTTATPAADSGQPRDEVGRFAPKAGDPEPVATQHVEQQPAPIEEPAGTMVPQQALHAERQKNRTLEQQMHELTGQIALLSRQVQQPRQAPPQPQEQPKAKDFWEDPDGFVQQQLTPLQDIVQKQNERVSRMLAVAVHGEEKVGSAFKAMAEALSNNPQANFEYQRIRASDHPFEELVRWHQRNETLNRIGTDPDAFVKSEIAKMLADPAKQAEILQQIQQSAAAQPANRSQTPATVLPPTLSRLPGGSNSAGGPDLSDEGLFKDAMRAR